MFAPNLIGTIAVIAGRDIHGIATFGAPKECPFAMINLNSKSEKTSVRADSSASRGSADELTSQKMKILIPVFVTVGIGDRFVFDGVKYDIISRHPRRSVFGDLDHYECDIEVLL